jgi:hypothetical protein
MAGLLSSVLTTKAKPPLPPLNEEPPQPDGQPNTNAALPPGATPLPTQNKSAPMIPDSQPAPDGLLVPKMATTVENVPEAAPTQVERQHEDAPGTVYANTGNGAEVVGQNQQYTNNGPVGMATTQDTTNAATAGGGGVGGSGTGVASWDPATGLLQGVQEAGTEDVTGTGYTAATTGEAQQATAAGYTAATYDPTLAPEAHGFTAEGYNPEGYTAGQTKENLSSAITRVTDAGGAMMARAENQGKQAAARRGLLASSLSVGAAQGAVLDRAQSIAAGDVQAEQFNVASANEALKFSTDARNQAAQFLAGAKNTAAQFLAAEQNQNGRFNAQQANDAARFAAEATNVASQFVANAQNMASQFNAGEANKLSMFAVDQANQASRFAAEADNAAKQFNAAAYNKAHQAYVDAMNSAIAAQFDAENLARRDTANATNQQRMLNSELANRIQTAGISASASVESARIGAEASRANADAARADNEANRQFTAEQNAANRAFQAGENELNRNESAEERAARQGQFNATLDYNNRTLGQSAFSQYTQGIDNINNNPNLDPEQRQTAISSWNAVWTGNPNLPIDVGNVHINPPGGTTTSGGTTPAGNGLSRGGSLGPGSGDGG